jgi:hypothetical protein
MHAGAALLHSHMPQPQPYNTINYRASASSNGSSAAVDAADDAAEAPADRLAALAALALACASGLPVEHTAVPTESDEIRPATQYVSQLCTWDPGMRYARKTGLRDQNPGYCVGVPFSLYRAGARVVL